MNFANTPRPKHAQVAVSRQLPASFSRRGCLTTLLLAVMLAATLPLHAQVAGGTIEGTVSDTTGGVVAGVQVLITNQATNVATPVKSNDSGFYVAANLAPGQYNIEFSAPSFSKTVAKDITLTVGQQQQINVTLKPGAVIESVVVTNAAPTVELATSTLGNVVDAKTVKELPLNGRDWTQLATLEPGVAGIRTQVALSTGPDRGNRGYGSQLTISGGRPAQNNYRLDGVSINDYSNGAPGSVLGANLGVDAVEEFSVLTSNYSAEYGRTSGGVVNAITRSGSNALHGTAYEFLRNSALDTRNYFDFSPVTGLPAKPPFKRNQFGASAGGPIVKDKTFIFGDYEGDRQGTSLTQPIQVPSQNDRSLATNPTIQKFLGLFPVPTDPASNSITSVVKQITSEDYFTVRGDHRLTSKDSLVGTYVFDRASTTQPDPLNIVLTGNSSRRQIATVEDTHTFNSALLNTVRVGFNRVVAYAGLNATAINPLATDVTLGVVPGRPAPGINFGDGTATIGGGLGASPTYRFRWNSFQLYDDAFLTKGIHFIKFGFATEYMQDNILASSDANGVIAYNTVQKFIQDQDALSFNAANPGSITERQIRQHIYAGYVQDDIRLKPNLTINAGVRYEVSTVPTENHGQLSVLRNLTDATPHLGSPFFSNPTFHNFEPRVGFAWDPLRTGKTSVRGGAGMFDVLPLPYFFELLTPLASPFYQLGSTQGISGGNFPGGFFGLLNFNPAPPNNLRQSYIEPKPKRNYVMQWNVSLQRELTHSLTGMVAYVGSRGVHQAFRADDVNSVLPADPNSLTPTFPGVDAGGNQLGTKLNPNVGQISSVFWNGDSTYKSLQAKLTARVGSVFQAQASYTWGNGIDTGSSTVGGDTFGNSISSLPYYNAKLRRGPSDFNISQNLVISYNAFLPSVKRFSAPINWALGSWQLGGVAQLSSGVPFTPIISGDVLGLGGTDPWNFPDRSTAPGCGSLVNPGNRNNYIKASCFLTPNPTNRRGNLGRNALVGPPLKNFDFSLIKNSPIKAISEAFNIQFRIEMFNIFNHANFAPPLNHLALFQQNGADARLLDSVPTAGQLDSTVTTSRQIQFGLKVIW